MTVGAKGPPGESGRVAVPGSERRLPPKATYLGPADPDEMIDVTLSLRRRPDGPPIPSPAAYFKLHPRLRPPLSRDDFATTYGASQADVDQVLAFAAAARLAVTSVDRAARTIVLRGTVTRMSAAFGVELGRYEHELTLGHTRKPEKQTFRGRKGAVHVPAALADIVVGVFGLDTRRIGKLNGSEPPNTGTLTTSGVAGLYDYPSDSAAGQTIGILSLSGYKGTDVTQFSAGAVVNDILINGATNPGSDPYAETTQDIQIALGFAPGAAINVYITTADQQGWVQAVTRVAHPSAGDSPCSVVSSSWYISNGDDSGTLGDEGVTVAFLNALSAAFQDAAIQGVTVCIACGDTGSDSKVGDGSAHVQYPGSDPWVLSIGGTTIGNVNGSAFDEYVWNDPEDGGWGVTGGGVSDFFAVPSYQSSVTVPASINDPSRHGRGVPDVAGNANDHSGYADVIWNGSPFTGNGTSASAPQWAALIAVINAALGVNVGFVNPALYALGGVGFRDIVPGGGPGDNADNGATGYPAGAGWDACTGLGSPRGKALLDALRAIYTRTLYFVVEKSTFGVDEVTDQLTHGGLFLNAFWLVLEGFSINQVGALTPSLSGAFAGLSGITIIPDPTPSYEFPGDLYTPQRIRFAFHVLFTSTASFPAAGDDERDELLAASMTLAGAIVTGATLFELTAGANPYFANLDPSNADQPFWLSQDLRVFSAAAGDTPLPGGPSFTSDPYASIQSLLGYLNSTPAYTTPGADLLNGLPGQSGYETGDSSVRPLNGSGNPLFNFAIGRVRLQGPSGSQALKTRVFFRLFVAESFDTDFQPSTTYKSTLGSGTEAGKPVFPLASDSGLTDPSGNSLKTVPFFATNASGSHDYDGTASNGNQRDLTIPAGRDKLWAYFGCFLDVYNAAHQATFPGTHHCLVGEIAYDDTPLHNAGGVTLTPSNSDKLAQRNLQITASGNPSYPETHRIPQAFDTRLTAPAPGAPAILEDLPDELMIDWKNVPPGSKASIYWPGMPSQAVIDLADRIYGAHHLQASEANTISCLTTRGVTYVPIPFGIGINLAGLLSIELPDTIHEGQELRVYVRRLASRRARSVKNPGGEVPGLTHLNRAQLEASQRLREIAVVRNWRYVTGAFEVRIPVRSDDELRRPEEDTLAILRWRLQHMNPVDRWYPVLKRYVTLVEDRVTGFGGDPATIPPSLTGAGHPKRPGSPGTPGKPREVTGRVADVLYDCRGDFEGFVLADCEHRHALRSCEPAISDLVLRACRERLTLTVVLGPTGNIVGIIVRCCGR